MFLLLLRDNVKPQEDITLKHGNYFKETLFKFIMYLFIPLHCDETDGVSGRDTESIERVWLLTS